MIAVIVLVVAGTLYLLGVFSGLCLQEAHTRRRERRLSRSRRDLAARIEALDAYVGVSRIVSRAHDVLERDAVRRDDLAMVLMDDEDDPGDDDPHDEVRRRREERASR